MSRFNEGCGVDVEDAVAVAACCGSGFEVAPTAVGVSVLVPSLGAATTDVASGELSVSMVWGRAAIEVEEGIIVYLKVPTRPLAVEGPSLAVEEIMAPFFGPARRLLYQLRMQARS